MAPQDIPWLTDPQLFLCSQGGVVQVWKCKKSSIQTLQPMKHDDFDYIRDVKDTDKSKPKGDADYLNLVVGMFVWDEKEYKALVKYISKRDLLVNGQGMLIAQLHKFGQDGKIDAKESPIYIRSLHILSLKTYIDGFMERTIPFRMTQYLEDKNGRVVQVEFSPKEVKLNEDIDKVKTEKRRLDKEIVGLNADIKTLEGNIIKLNAEITAQISRIANIKQERSRVKTQLERKISDLEVRNRNLEGQVESLDAEITKEKNELVRLQQELNRVNTEIQERQRKANDLQDQINRG